MAVVFLNPWGPIKKPSWEHGTIAWCVWLIIHCRTQLSCSCTVVLRRALLWGCSLSSLSHRCCASGHCYFSSSSSSLHNPYSCISIQQANTCMAFLITRRVMPKGCLAAPGDSDQRRFGLAGNNRDGPFPSLMKGRYFYIAAWVGKREEEEPRNMVIISNVVPSKNSEEMKKQNLFKKKNKIQE